MSAYFVDMADNPFLLTGLVAGLLAGVACGLVGPWVVTRRIVFLAGAVAHLAIGGVGASIFLAHRFPTVFAGVDPLIGATVAAIAAALLLAWVQRRAAERVDTLIGALWAVGVAIGVLLIKFTPGYQSELMSYLFGNLVFVSWPNVALLAVLDLAIVGTGLAFHKRFLALALDEEQAALQGVAITANHAVLLVLVALVVITLTRIVGLVLVIALVSLPAATAARFATRLSGVIGLSIVLCVVLFTLPRIAVYGTRISPEPAIVLTAATVYLLSTLYRGGRIPP